MEPMTLPKRWDDFLGFLEETDSTLTVDENGDPLVVFKDQGHLNFFNHMIVPEDPRYGTFGTKLEADS